MSDSPLDQRFLRNPRVTEREVGEATFLANPDRGSLYRLNDIVAGLWRLLAEPTTADEAVAVFQEAFPESAPETIEDDVTGVFFDLVEEGLIEPVG